MKERNTIQQIQHNGHLAYTVTKSGEYQYRKSLGFGDVLNGIQDKGGKTIPRNILGCRETCGLLN